MSASGSAVWWSCAVSLAGVAALSQLVVTEAAPPPGPIAMVQRVNDAMGLAESVVFDLEPPVAPGDGLVAVIPIDGLPQVVHLEPHSVRAEGYQVLVQGANGLIVVADPGPVNTLRGTVLGVEGSVVAASVLDDGVHARVIYPDGTEWWVQPIAGAVPDARPSQHVVYPATATPGGCGTCDTDAAVHSIEPGVPGVPGVPDGEPQAVSGGAGGFCIAQLACDTDYEFYQARGSVAATTAWINAVVNAVNVQYERDVNITHTITTIVVRSSSNDPYNNTKNASSLLSQVQAEWQGPQSGQPHDLAQLFTGRDLAGTTIGIAWVGSVCTAYKYSLVESGFNGPSVDSCATDLSAHEMGHNWGASHCSCTSYTMNAYITCANVFHPTLTIPAIIAHRDSRTCLDNCGGGQVPTGACCVAGSCSIQTAADCSAAGGAYQGDGTGCSPSPCGGGDPTGACCLGTTCVIETAANCLAGAGSYLGDGSSCSGSPCGGGAIVDCITYVTRGGPSQNKHLDVTVTVINGGGNPVAGAGVSMTLTRASGGSWSFGGTTDATGEVTFTLLSAGDGCYTSDVTAISGAGAFDGTEPFNGFNKGTDPFPDADCRSGSDGC